MPTVKLSVNDKTYEVICEEGEEEHLFHLASYLDEKARSLGLAPGKAGEARVMLLVGLILADELFEARSSIESLEKNLDSKNGGTMDEELSKLLGEASRKIISVAQTINRVAGK